MTLQTCTYMYYCPNRHTLLVLLPGRPILELSERMQAAYFWCLCNKFKWQAACETDKGHWAAKTVIILVSSLPLRCCRYRQAEGHSLHLGRLSGALSCLFSFCVVAAKTVPMYQYLSLILMSYRFQAMAMSCFFSVARCKCSVHTVHMYVR